MNAKRSPRAWPKLIQGVRKSKIGEEHLKVCRRLQPQLRSASMTPQQGRDEAEMRFRREEQGRNHCCQEEQQQSKNQPETSNSNQTTTIKQPKQHVCAGREEVAVSSSSSHSADQHTCTNHQVHLKLNHQQMFQQDDEATKANLQRNDSEETKLKS